MSSATAQNSHVLRLEKENKPGVVANLLPFVAPVKPEDVDLDEKDYGFQPRQEQPGSDMMSQFRRRQQVQLADQRSRF